VVKRLVEMHGGSVTAASEGLGRGSEFTVRLPAAMGLTDLRPPAAGRVKTARQGARVLIADDDEDTARLLGRLLGLAGHEVVTAHRGDEAIGAAKAFRPEFILLDIGMPGMSGYEVASRLRRDECCEKAVFIAVSGYGQEQDRERSREAGFDQHLTKPLDHDALLSMLSAERT
jgi:CheY-like chemotaxis protein